MIPLTGGLSFSFSFVLLNGIPQPENNNVSAVENRVCLIDSVAVFLGSAGLYTKGPADTIYRLNGKIEWGRLKGCRGGFLRASESHVGRGGSTHPGPKKLDLASRSEKYR